jgi:Nitric oxide synthase, oxygenase domain
VRFACWELADGTTMGDKANKELTKTLVNFGWTPPEPKTEFDVLPIVIETPEHGARVSYYYESNYYYILQCYYYTLVCTMHYVATLYSRCCCTAMLYICFVCLRVECIRVL